MKKFIVNLLMRLARRKLGLKSHTVHLSIGPVVYLDSADPADNDKDKETLLLIHGLGADKDGWLQLSKYLTKDYRVVIPDLPGHGQSIRGLELDYSIQQQARHVRELLDTLGIDRAHCIGSSMGGAIIAQLAHMNPDKVSSLILIGSYGIADTPSAVDQYIKDKGYNPILEVKDSKDFKKMLSFNMATPPDIPKFILDVLAMDMKSRIQLNQKIYADIERDGDLTQILPDIQAPSLVIWGENDKILHAANADIFKQQIPDCKKILLKKAGHVPMIEYPQELSVSVLHFVRTTSS